jgi:hypothetical protein
MKKHLTPQALTDCFSLGMVAAILLISGIVWHERHYSSKFNQTRPKTTLASLKSQWGEPDYHNTGRTKEIVMFYDRSICGKYFFIFDKDSVLTSKGLDD